MTIDEPGTFDRRFVAADMSVFRDLTAGVIGQPCVAWRKSYGRTGHFHFGALVERPHLPPKAIHRATGEWIIDLADADRILTRSSGEQLDSRRDGDDLVMASFGAFEGKELRALELDPSTLSLRLTMNDGHILDLVTDEALTAKDEQWAIQLPSGLALVAYASQRWSVEHNRPSGSAEC
jgi:hypothetical protein